MEVVVNKYGDEGVVVMEVSGSVDSETVDRFSQAVKGVLEEGCRCLLMDLRGLTYINTSGLSVIADAFRKAHQCGGSLKLAGARPEIKELLDVVRFTRIIDIFDDINEALRSCGAG